MSPFHGAHSIPHSWVKANAFVYVLTKEKHTEELHTCLEYLLPGVCTAVRVDVSVCVCVSVCFCMYQGWAL